MNPLSTDQAWRRHAVMLGVSALAFAAVGALADAAREHDGVSRVDPVVVGGLALIVFALLVTRHSLARAATFALGIGGSGALRS